MEWWYRFWWLILQPLVKVYFRLSTVGQDHVPLEGPVLIASNHCSHLDPPLVALALRRQVNFLAKKELFSVPFVGFVIRWFGGYPVVRGKSDFKAIRTILRLMKNQKMLLMFPEGTRSETGAIQPLENGLPWLAMKSGAQVLPVYVEGTYHAFPRKAWFPRPFKVRVWVGEALDPKKLEKKGVESETLRYVKEAIETAMANLATEAKSAST